jgi:hypothetical protein
MASRQIFITYRRSDTRADAGRLFDRLDARYPGCVFRDVGSLEPGVEWQEAVDEVLGATNACVVVIGPHWLDAADASGKRRIDDPHDTVRKEVSVALKSGMRVFPVLVGGAAMPGEHDLPEELQPLARRNALELSEQDFDAGLDKLVKAIERIPGWGARQKTWAAPFPVIALVAGFALLGIIVATFISRQASTSTSSTETIQSAVPSQPSSTAPPGPSSIGPSTASPALVQDSRASAPQSPDSASSNVAPAIAQITLKWNGVNAVDWQILDARTKEVLRHQYSSRAETAVDVAPGDYLVVLDGAPEVAAIPVKVTAGGASAVIPPVGQITLKWNGINAVDWQILNARTKEVLRHRYSSRAETAADVAPGDYLVVLDGAPEVTAIPVKVAAGRASAVIPPVGQITLKWNGLNAVDWQILDASAKAVLRHKYSSRAETVVDVAPGRYVIVLDGKPEIKPIPISVVAGKAAPLNLP